MVWTILAAVVVGIWSYALILLWRIRSAIPYLRNQPDALPCPADSEGSGPWPRVTVVAAARNEERSIEGAVRSWFESDYPNLNVVVINDRSTDKTADILADLGSRYPSLKVHHVTELPEGWLGKTHALNLGAFETKSEWILFTDADVTFHPKAIRKAIVFSQTHGLDHITCTPESKGGTWASRGLLSIFAASLLLYFRPHKIRSPKSNATAGIGAFNLVKTSVYRQIGGHQGIALCTGDDLKLGKLVKLNHFRQMLLFGNGMIAVPWYRTVPEAARALEKNLFTAFNYSLTTAFLASGGAFIAFFVPYLGIFFASGFQVISFAAAIVAQLAIFGYMGRLTGVPMTAALSVPVNAASIFYCVIRSIYMAKKRGGIMWRDCLYPLAELRKKGKI
ncbi:MAG: glycosyltransferase family 2 protein [Candidatus Manganitrophus sp. SB1]|nr:glycosyltransferase family 2 protein [Candidatus Manganitrophus morganii]